MPRRLRRVKKKNLNTPLLAAGFFINTKMEADMIKGLSLAVLRGLIDKAGYSHKIDEDGDILMTLNADNDFGYDVYIFFQIQGENDTILKITGYAFDFPVNNDNKANLVYLCNKWNREKRLPKAYVDIENNRVIAEENYFLDEAVSEEYVLESCIKLTTSGIWGFFKSLVK